MGGPRERRRRERARARRPDGWRRTHASPRSTGPLPARRGKRGRARIRLLAPMGAERIVLGRGIGGLADLGLAVGPELFEPAAELGPRGRWLAREAGRSRLRLPLPGTPDEQDARGRLTGRPGPAGTGWIVVERWSDAPLSALLAARFRAPRSASLAERSWNLACHLRAHGIDAPEPLAVGALGRGLVARRSFLVTRELAGYVPLPALLAALPPGPPGPPVPPVPPVHGDVREAGPRARALQALGAALARLFAAGVHPRALPAELFQLSPPEDAAGDAAKDGTQDGAEPAARAAAGAQSGAACALDAPVPGLRPNRLPSVALLELPGARLGPPLGAARRALLVRDLVAELARVLAPEEAERLLALALGAPAGAPPPPAAPASAPADRG